MMITILISIIPLAFLKSYPVFVIIDKVTVDVKMTSDNKWGDVRGPSCIYNSLNFCYN